MDSSLGTSVLKKVRGMTAYQPLLDLAKGVLCNGYELFKSLVNEVGTCLDVQRQ